MIFSDILEVIGAIDIVRLIQLKWAGHWLKAERCGHRLRYNPNEVDWPRPGAAVSGSV